MAKYLVTGGAGFIGSHLAEALVERGDTVAILDDFSTGQRKNISAIADRITLHEGSITDLEECRAAVRGVDFVLHEAALPSVSRSIEKPAPTARVNAGGTLNMLIASRDEGVRRFVMAGSSSAYGNPAVFPSPETLPANPLSPYAISKVTGEMFTQHFCRAQGLETIVLRYFNVFGPRQDPGSQYSAVIPRFISLFLDNRPPTIYGDGSQSRDFTLVDNVVRANLLACAAPSEAVGEIFNCACGETLSLGELTDEIKRLTGSTAEIQYGPARPGEVHTSQADISKAGRLLGYHPSISPLEGLEIVTNWYSQHRAPPPRAAGA